MNIEVVDSTPSICTDSDGGVIYNEKGKVHGLEAPNVWDDWVDYCGVAGEETGKLVEYSCEQNDYGKKNLYECPNGCSDGACIQTMPSVTVLSPNGGEYYNNDGSPINVTWSTKNVPSNFTFDVIRLRGYPNGGEIILSQNVTNDGSDVISFKGVPAGEYTLEMKAYLNGVLVMDSSDSSFTVIASTNVTQIQSSHFSTPVDAANTLARLRIIMDYSANPSNYRVDQVIIRQEYLKIMLSAMKLIPAASYQCQNIFSDISEPWICAVAETALANGLISKQTNEAGQTLFRGADALSVYEILVLNLKSQCIKPESTSIS